MILPRRILRSASFIALSFAAAAAWAAVDAPASPAAAPRVQGPVDDAARVALYGNMHPSIQAGADQGAVEDSLPAGRMLLLLARSPEQESALREFLQAAHTPGNPSFHKWLTPAEFGRLYGPADSDVAAVTAWLESHGLAVNQVHAGRLAIEFSGTTGQLREAFQTEVHRYLVNGETRLSSATDPSVPAALGPVIAGLAPINGFHPQPHLKVLGQASFNPKTRQATPQWTYPAGNGGVLFVMAPGDFATQYDINPVYKAGITGAGQSIAVLSASNVDLSMVQAYQTLFGLSANLPQVVVDGEDPGQNGAAAEAYLDLEIAGSVAPGATLMLYTSAGTALADGLALAAYRAVEDNQAGIISSSYGECEMELGQGGNAFWSALWQQAAAQGQTVFVSVGDGGSAGCDSFDTQQVAYSGLQVNGIASTPYNVAVGGTDFYYSQYAGSTSAINTQVSGYWSAPTTAPAVSLKQPVPEQAWNDYFGYNLADGGNPANLPSQMIVAGGGGASSAALYPSGSAAQGYPKPAWQTGTGVPADKARDLPDLSLFAANGTNYSLYPICALPGDCSNLTSSGAVAVTGIGGTSASTQAMAGIQALINQSTASRQGQADFIYYPLAAKQTTVFRDVAVGGNQVLCYLGTANCAAGSAAGNSSGYYVESGYAAGAGFDLATGLGSVDVANLIKYWNSVTRTPTTTTLSVSPSSFVHGLTATVKGSVAPSAGSGTPTGSVSLTGSDGLPHYAAIDNPSLTAGSFYAQVDNLPGGTYQLTAVYGGDGSFAASNSQPVTVTITPENDTLVATGWAWNPFDLNLYTLSSGITLPYGAQIFLDAQPVSSNATIAGQPTPATGTVTFTDNLGAAATSSTQPLDAAGVAEWSTGVFAPGSHEVSESYSGDASYNPSTAAASFTVIPGSTSLAVKPLVSTVAAGASVAVDVKMATGYLPLYGTLPTGNVTVTLGGSSISAPWQPYGSAGSATLEAVVTFSNLPASLLPLTASYSGDGNWLGSAANGGMVVALASRLTPTVTLTSSSANPAPNQSFTLTATAAGPVGMPTPTGTVLFLSDGESFLAITTLSKGTAAFVFPGYAPANGTNIFTAVYQGDANYNSAASNPVNVAIAQSDFSLTTQNAELQISPSGSGSGTLALAPVNGFSGTVTLSASAPAGFTATPAAASLVLGAPATDAVTITVAAGKAPGAYSLAITASGGGHVHTAQILVQVLPVAAPVFSPAAGTYTTQQQVTLADATPGAVIYYTTNGATPTASSTKYTGAIPVSASAPATETIQAIALVSGSAPSSVASATYIMAPPAAMPSISPAAGVYASAQSITLADSTPGATIYYTTNGVAPTTSSTAYAGPIAVSATETIQAIAAAPGYSTSAIASASYTISVQTATPAFSPAGGTYATAQTVSITDSTHGATIYYTTNGVAPTTSSTVYTGPIAVSATETIQAIAVAPGDSLSAVASASYAIGAQTASPVFWPAGGTFASGQTVHISDTTPGATIYYTTNGTMPTTNSPVYSSNGITVTTAGAVRAFAVAKGFASSPIVTTVYVVLPPSLSPTFSPAGGSYSTVQTVTLSDQAPGAAIYYTTDGSTPTTNSPRYTGPITVSSLEVIRAFALAGGYANSPIITTVYVVTLPTAEPVFSPAAGTYSAPQSVTITDATPGATIYYTTNGTAPNTNSTRYTGAIPVSATETLKAIAAAPGYSTSPVTTAKYTLTGAAVRAKPGNRRIAARALVAP
jgi:hypothetical protein